MEDLSKLVFLPYLEVIDSISYIVKQIKGLYLERAPDITVISRIVSNDLCHSVDVFRLEQDISIVHTDYLVLDLPLKQIFYILLVLIQNALDIDQLDDFKTI